MANVLVTGANGFVGSHVVEALLARGYRVRASVRKSANLQWLSKLPIEIRYGVLAEAETLQGIADDIDYVMHIAAATKAGSEKEFYQANVASTINLMNACISSKSKIKRFVFFSTLAVTGGAEKQSCLTETHQCKPISRYAQSKFETEIAVLREKQLLPIVILRISAIYGPRDTESLAYFKFLKQGIRPIFGKTSSLCYIQDVVQSAILAMEKEVPSGSIYHISDGKSYTLDDVAKIAEKLLNKKTLRLRLPIPVLSLYAHIMHRINPNATVLSKDKVDELVQDCWVCDIQKAVNELGFKPAYTLEQGLEETIKWYQVQKWL